MLAKPFITPCIPFQLCLQCKDPNKNNKGAVAYCAECKHVLCTTCLSTHTRDHGIEYKYSIVTPRSKLFVSRIGMIWEWRGADFLFKGNLDNQIRYDETRLAAGFPTFMCLEDVAYNPNSFLMPAPRREEDIIRVNYPYFRRKPKPTWSEQFRRKMVTVSRSELLLVNPNSCSILLSDLENKVVFEQYLEDKPHDAACLDSDLVAVSLPWKNKIQVLSILKGLSPVGEIKVSGECWGICYSDGKMVVSYWYPRRIEVLSMDGTVLWRYDIFEENLSVLPDVEHYLKYKFYDVSIITQQTDKGKYIYAVGLFFNRITKFNFDGQICFILETEELIEPSSLAALTKNLILVSSHQGSKLSLINDEDGSMRIVRQWDVDSRYSIKAMEFDPNTEKLYVISEKDSIAKGFECQLAGQFCDVLYQRDDTMVSCHGKNKQACIHKEKKINQ